MLNQNSPMGSSTAARWINTANVVLLAVCIVQCSDLLMAWRDGPLDRFGWLALTIWLLPLVYLASGARQCVRPVGQRIPWIAAAVLCASFGGVGSLNAAQHLGLLLAVASVVAGGWRGWLWTLSGLSWLPAFGWAVSKLNPAWVLPARLSLAILGAVFLTWAAVAVRNRQSAAVRADWRPRLTAVTVGVVLVASLLWQFVPLEGAEERLVALPVRGASFRSEGASLSESELKLLGDALACRRVYQFASQRVLVSIIDATHNRHAVHDPLYCFVGAGWHAVEDQRQPVAGGYARVVRFEREGEYAQLAFWFSNGNVRHCSPLRYWLQTTVRRLTCGLSGPEPVLVIIQNYDEQPVNWGSVLAPGSPFFSV